MANSDDRHGISNSRSALPQPLQSSSDRAYHAYRTTAFPPYDRITPENSPSNVAAANQPFDHLISAEAVVSAESKASVVPANA